MPHGYELRPMAPDDVVEVVQKLRLWYPEIAVGAESCHLEPDFYYRETVLDEHEHERSILPIVARHAQSIVGFITFERNIRALTITSRVGAVDPAHRGPGLGLLGPLLLETLGRALGAELAYYLATLKSPHQQVLAERARYQLVGIVPGFDRSLIGPSDVKRVPEALYAKVLVAEHEVLAPTASALTPRTRALWQALFGTPPQG